MQLNVSALPPMPAPTNRVEAAKALAAVPMGAVMVATMTAMPKAMAGEQASAAELVAPFLQKVSPADAKTAMLQALDGALALAPELADRAEALRQAAAGLETVLAALATDTAQQGAKAALETVTARLEPILQPVVEAATLLDPNFGEDAPH